MTDYGVFSYTRSPVSEHDLPNVNEYIYCPIGRNFYRVVSVDNGTVIFNCYKNTTVSVDWTDPKDRRAYKLSKQRPMYQQLNIQQQRVQEILKDENSEKLALIGKNGKCYVLKAHAKLVSQSFNTMILRCQNNELKVELGLQAMEIFKSYIHCFWLDPAIIDVVAFSELVDLCKMYFIEKLRELLVDLMMPILSELPTIKFVQWQHALGSLPENEYARFLDSWRCKKQDDEEELLVTPRIQVKRRFPSPPFFDSTCI